MAAASIQRDEIRTLVDLGVGSGTFLASSLLEIPPAYLRNHNLDILGVDISEDALRIAMDNVSRATSHAELGPKISIRIKKSDWLSSVRKEDLKGPVLFYCNPPFLRPENKVKAEFRNNPTLALFTEGRTEFPEIYDGILRQAVNVAPPGSEIILRVTKEIMDDGMYPDRPIGGYSWDRIAGIVGQQRIVGVSQGNIHYYSCSLG